ncbi:hypothetical protein ABWH96_09515 [Marivirga tractuosa]|uniref:hypothetical protein n=1 Tax=Marivirga tractuosa TaxID=1006 RepID=UPI0035CF42E9
MMNYLLSLFFILTIAPTVKVNNESEQKEVLQSIFDIEEFQNYLTYSPRFVGTNTRLEVLMIEFPELIKNDIDLKVRNKSIRIISEQQIKELEHNFFIRINAFDLKKSKAKVTLSYQNSRMYYESEQKLMLEAKLEKNKMDKWVVENYELKEVKINTSD